MSGDVKPVLAHCNECGQETKHDVLHRASRSRSWEDGQHSVDFGTSWKLLQCRGCEEVSMQRNDWCSEDFPDEGPTPGVFFPPRVSRKKPDWFRRNEYDVPSEYLGLLEEVYTALHADSRRLAVMGARALVDAVIRRNVGDRRNFGDGLDALESAHLIGKKEREIISAAVDVGNASAHRGHSPKAEDVHVVMDIVERLIQSEILAGQARELKETTPKRTRPVGKKK